MSEEKISRIQTTLLENRSSVVNASLILVDILTVSLAILLSGCIRWLLIPIMGGIVNWSLIFNGLVFYVIFTILLAW